MDSKQVARYSAYLTAVFIMAMFLSWVVTVEAQAGICPDNHTTIQTPYGTYPGPTAYCATNPATQSVVNHSALPCNSGLLFDSEWGVITSYESFVFVPPANQTFPTGYASFSFALTIDWVLLGAYSPDAQVEVRSYAPSGAYLGYRKFTHHYAQAYPEPDMSTSYFSTVTGNMHDLAGNTPAIDHIPFVQGGYFRFILTDPTNPSLINRYYVSDLRIVDSYYTVPQPCDDDYPVPTFTPTPLPTSTPENSPTPTHTPENSPTPSPSPTGTWEPTPTTPPTATPTQPPPPTATPTQTPWPTSSEITPSPQATATDYAPEIVTGEPTGTSIPPISLPTLQLSTVAAPSVPSINTPQPFTAGVTPNATTSANIDTVETWVDDVGIVATRWVTATNQGFSWLDTGTISDTGTVSSTVQIAQGMIDNVAGPVSYIRAVSVYMPNLWPYLQFIFFLFVWVVFNLLAKFGIAIVSEVLELIRKGIELIPGF